MKKYNNILIITYTVYVYVTYIENITSQKLT